MSAGNKNKKKLRPGVPAAQKLACDDNVEHWKQVEVQFAACTAAAAANVSSSSALLLQSRRDELSHKLLQQYRQNDDSNNNNNNNNIALTKQELMEIVLEWKFSVGKVRPAVRKLVQQNSNEQVQASTRAGFMAAMQLVGNVASDDGDAINNNKNYYNGKALQNVLQQICALRGMGPAGASAVLSLVRPDIFAYMYDEVIEIYCPKRVYTFSAYAQMNQQCWQKAKQLTSLSGADSGSRNNCKDDDDDDDV